VIQPYPGDVLDGKYLLKRVIGSGSSATVFEAEHVVVGKRAAIKVLSSQAVRDPQTRASFIAEGRAAARIEHVHVVNVYDFGITPENHAYLVMEMLRGETLQEALRDRGAVGETYACELVLQLLAGLSAAHALGIVHRDLKPANVLITHPRPDRPHVKVLDFGIASGIPKTVPDDPKLVLGTPMYMAPEQATGQQVDARADVYATGVILYELLVGRPAFQGTTAREVMERVARGQAQPLQEALPGVNPELAGIVNQAMARKRDQRLGSAIEFAERLGRFLSPGRVLSLVPDPAQSLPPIPLVHAIRRPPSSKG
jgi:serine/threonine-protein kinase